MPSTEFAIKRAYGFIIASYSPDEIVAKLGELGVIRSVAQRVIAFVPIAFGRVLLDGTGITLSDTYLVERDGQMVERRFDDEDVYRTAYALAKSGQVTAPVFNVIARTSSEVDAANQALNAGAQLENLVAGPPALTMILDDTEPPKKWWEFWRK